MGTGLHAVTPAVDDLFSAVQNVPCLYLFASVGYSSLSSTDSDALRSLLFFLLRRNVSLNVCFLQSYLISGGPWSLVWFHWRLYRLKHVYSQTLEYGKNTGGDWYTHMFGPANACAFAHRLSTCQRRMVQTDRHKFRPAATLGGACSGLSQSLWMLYRSSTEALGIIEQLNDHIPEWTIPMCSTLRLTSTFRGRVCTLSLKLT